VVQNLKFKVLQPFLVAERTLKHIPSGICGILQDTASISAFSTGTRILIEIGASDFFFSPLCFYSLLFLYMAISSVAKQFIEHTVSSLESQLEPHLQMENSRL